MNDAGFSLADIRAATACNNNDGYGFGNGGWFWIIILLFFCGGWNRNGNYGEIPLVSDEFIKRDIFNTNQNVSTSACQTQRDVLENRYTTQLGLANLASETQECCCETQKEILQSRYDNALGMQNIQGQLAQCCCDLKAAIHSEGEATRGLIQANTIQDLRDKVNERDRELQSAQFQISQVSQTSNIVNTLRPFPQPAYITCSPYQSYSNCGYGCGCNNY